MVKNAIGFDDSDEEPKNPCIVIDTRGLSPELATHRIFVKLESLGFIR